MARRFLDGGDSRDELTSQTTMLQQSRIGESGALHKHRTQGFVCVFRGLICYLRLVQMVFGDCFCIMSWVPLLKVAHQGVSACGSIQLILHSWDHVYQILAPHGIDPRPPDQCC